MTSTRVSTTLWLGGFHPSKEPGPDVIDAGSFSCPHKFAPPRPRDERMRVAQLAEHSAPTREAAGSTPAAYARPPRSRPWGVANLPRRRQDHPPTLDAHATDASHDGGEASNGRPTMPRRAMPPHPHPRPALLPAARARVRAATRNTRTARLRHRAPEAPPNMASPARRRRDHPLRTLRSTHQPPRLGPRPH